MEEKFIEYMKENRLSENTISSYATDVRLFIKYFKDQFDEEVIKIEHIIVTEYIKALTNKKRTAETINRKISAIKMYNDFLIEIGIQNENVIKPKDYIKLQPKLMAPYSPTEKEVLKLKLTAKDNKRDLAIITTFAHGGIRVSELIRLELTDLKFESKSIVINGKGNKVRMIVMADVVYDTLQDYLEERRQERNT